MSITAEKKRGKPTGHWRVEVGGKDNRLRGRAGDFEGAKAMEEQFRRRLVAGERVEGPEGQGVARVAPLVPTTLLDAVQHLGGALWGEGEWATTAMRHVTTLATLIGPNRPLTGLTDEDFQGAAKTLLKTKSPSTVNRALSSVSKLLKASRKKGWMTKEISLPWQREPKGRKRVLTPVEEERLLSFMPEDMRAFCILAVETGCRRGELLRIREEDRTRANWLVLPLTKSGETQGVPLTERAQEAFDTLMRLGVPGEQRARQQYEIAREKALLTDGVCFHSYRHTCCTRLLEAGVDVQECQEWMRHSDIETTLGYRHVSSKKLEETAVRLQGLGVSTFFRSRSTAK